MAAGRGELQRVAEQVLNQLPELIGMADRIVVMSARPGRIVADIPVDIPRPRTVATIDSVRFTEYSRQVRGYLYATEATS